MEDVLMEVVGIFFLFWHFSAASQSRAEQIWDVTPCGKCSVQLQYKQSFLLHVLKL